MPRTYYAAIDDDTLTNETAVRFHLSPRALHDGDEIHVQKADKTVTILHVRASGNQGCIPVAVGGSQYNVHLDLVFHDDETAYPDIPNPAAQVIHDFGLPSSY